MLSSIASKDRAALFEEIFRPPHEFAGYALSEHATTISYDVQIAYSAGAWLSVIVLACAAIDAQLQEVEIGGLSGIPFSKSIRSSEFPDKLNELRSIRNRIVHPRDNEIIKQVDIELTNGFYEEQATNAIRLLAATFYMSPWL